MKSLEFYLNKIGDTSKNAVYLEIGYERDEREVISDNLKMGDIRLYVDTVAAISKHYNTDNICNMFNAVNWGEDISKEDVKKLNKNEKRIYNLYKQYVNCENVSYEKNPPIREGYNDYCFTKKGWAFLFAMKMAGGVFKYEKVSYNTCNSDNLLDKEIYFITHFNLCNNWYSFIGIHGGGDLRGGYFDFLMVKNSEYGFELGFNLYEVGLSYIPNKDKILEYYFQDDIKNQPLLSICNDYSKNVDLFLDVNFPENLIVVKGDGSAVDYISQQSSSFGLGCTDKKFFSSFFTKKLDQNIYLFNY